MRVLSPSPLRAGCPFLGSVARNQPSGHLTKRHPAADKRRRSRLGDWLGLIDEYHLAVHPVLAGHGPTLFVMKLNHLAICARDVAASQDFYCTYFGFRQGPGPGLLASEEGFALAIHEVHEVPTLPACVHFGFFLATRAQAVELCERMRREGVVIAEEPEEHLGDLLFFCRDPAGFLVEVRGMGAPDAAPAP